MRKNPTTDELGNPGVLGGAKGRKWSWGRAASRSESSPLCPLEGGMLAPPKCSLIHFALSYKSAVALPRSGSLRKEAICARLAGPGAERPNSEQSSAWEQQRRHSHLASVPVCSAGDRRGRRGGGVRGPEQGGRDSGGRSGRRAAALPALAAGPGHPQAFHRGLASAVRPAQFPVFVRQQNSRKPPLPQSFQICRATES